MVRTNASTDERMCEQLINEDITRTTFSLWSVISVHTTNTLKISSWFQCQMSCHVQFPEASDRREEFVGPENFAFVIVCSDLVRTFHWHNHLQHLMSGRRIQTLTFILHKMNTQCSPISDRKQVPAFFVTWPLLTCDTSHDPDPKRVITVTGTLSTEASSLTKTFLLEQCFWIRHTTDYEVEWDIWGDGDTVRPLTLFHSA